MKYIGKIKIKQYAAVVCLLIVWQLLSTSVGGSILLPAPLAVIQKASSLLLEESFTKIVLFSSLRILLGFMLGMVSGCIFAFFAARFSFMEYLFRPLMSTVKSVPVVSFIIIALMWLGAASLSAFISFLIVLPIIYNNILSGIKSIDKKMLAMADIFRLNYRKRIMYIYLPGVKTQLLSSAGTALGMAWKAGIAAEVIAIPSGSIGEKLYMSKVCFDSCELLAWTLIIVILSASFEKVLLLLFHRAYKKLEEI